MEKNHKEKEAIKKVSIEDKDGLKISYDKSELKEYIPHLIKEISKNEKSIKMDSVRMEIERNYEDDNQNSRNFYSDELINPGAIDFIRRCAKNEEALTILDYLLERKELSRSDYKSLKSQLMQEDGLKKIINKHGGFKKPGYYERKYRTSTREKTRNDKN